MGRFPLPDVQHHTNNSVNLSVFHFNMKNILGPYIIIWKYLGMYIHVTKQPVDLWHSISPIGSNKIPTQKLYKRQQNSLRSPL